MHDDKKKVCEDCEAKKEHSHGDDHHSHDHGDDHKSGGTCLACSCPCDDHKEHSH